MNDGKAVPTLQIGDESEEDNVRLSSSGSSQLEDAITVEQFSQLVRLFHRYGEWRRSTGTTQLATADFCQILAKLLGYSEDDEKIIMLCNKIDADDKGVIEEEEFYSYMLQQLKEKDSLVHVRSLPFQDPPKFKHNMHSKETLCRVVTNGNTSRYITVSKDGVAGVWTTSLHFQRGSMLDEGLDRGVGQKVAKKGTLWVTDCVTMSNCNKLVLSTNSRELMFYDISTTLYTCQFRLHDLPSVPLCLNHYSCSESPSSPCYLLYGDVSGSVVILTFHKPTIGLFLAGQMEEDSSPKLIPFSRLVDHTSLVSMQYMSQLHSDWVRKVSYVWHNHSFISCANTALNSLIMKDIGKKKKSYVFKIRKGVLCYDFCHELDILATGSMDHTVRLWNPYVPSKPVAQLTVHTTSILDVVIAKDMGLIFSYSQDSVLCAWDIFEHVLVQKITVKFPFSQRLPDHGPSILHILQPTNSLCVLCNEYIAEFKVGSALSSVGSSTASLRSAVGNKQSVWSVTSHEHPLCAALYNAHFRQVVSGCEGGEVNVWNIDSGGQILRFTHAHDKHEITAMALDSSGRRLITGSRAGDIKVWNYMDSSCMKHMRNSCYAEVTAVMHLLDKSKFISVGWNKKITTFPDQPDVLDVKPDDCWQGQETHHDDDILCVTYAPPCYLATGSFDGEIRIWNMDTEKVMNHFHSISKLKPSLMFPTRKKSLALRISRASRTSFHSSRVSLSSQPASRKLSAYKIRSGFANLQHVPIDRVIFLRTRVCARQKGSAQLVSSEAGVARFWDIFSAKKEPLGSFLMSEFDEESVLAMKIDPKDSYLLAGDTAGFIAIFDIKNYCTSPHSTPHNENPPRPLVKWRAHAGEILSIDYIAHKTQPLVLSASGDRTVRLWTLQGHYVGTFGQDQPWDLRNPSTFQHPNTPWGELQRPRQSSLSPPPLSSPPPNENDDSRSRHTPPVLMVVEEARRGSNDAMPVTESTGQVRSSVQFGSTAQMLSSASSSTSSLINASCSNLPQVLLDKSLGADYNESIHRRMVDRHDRRTNFSEIDTKSVERFGHLCSPFQALQVLKMDDVKVPREMSTALNVNRTRTQQ